MGYAIAEAFAEEGADVQLVSGPVQIETKAKISISKVTSAQEMFGKTVELSKKADIIIMAAAVADYRPAIIAEKKIKKAGENLNIQLEPTPDILKHLGENKNKHQILVGFALETNDEESNAIGKLIKKKLDIIILNSLNDQGAGFGYDTNKITIIDKHNKKQVFGLNTKKETAINILEYVCTFASQL